MKLSILSLSLWLGLFQSVVQGQDSSTPTTTTTTTTTNSAGCVETVEEGKDYFPFKTTIEYSKLWTVDYEFTYKIVQNKAHNETYVLYQCGTEPPTDIPNNNGTFAVPLTDVGLLSTTYIPFLEMLGARDVIKTFFSPASYVSSPCFTELLDAGVVLEVPDVTNVTLLTEDTLELPSFVYKFPGYESPLNHEIVVSEWEEAETLAVFEWIKFFALFLNKEEDAAAIFQDTKSRFVCATENAGLLACDEIPRPKVLWGSYSSFCGGWDTASCPNYYCELASNCQAELMTPEDRGSFYSEACFMNYMTTEEFVAFGKDADIWIYNSADFDTTLAEYGTELSEFKSVQNQKVFDTEGSGSKAWFEQRLVEPDVILQDFCAVVGSENVDSPVQHTRVWLRNVFEESVGSLGTCDDVKAPLVTRATQCFPVASDFCDTRPTSDVPEPPTTDEEPADGDAAGPKPSRHGGVMVTSMAILLIATFV